MMSPLKFLMFVFQENLRGLLRSTLKEKDLARRQYILNVLLLSSIVLTLVALLITVFQDYVLGMVRVGDSPRVLFIFLIIYVFSMWLSKKGQVKIVAFCFIAFYLFLISNSIYRWGPDMPIGLLIYSLLIVMTGILVSSKVSFLITIFISLYLALLTYFNTSGQLKPDLAWKQKTVDVVDWIIFSIIFFIIATVSWLFNRESERALKRARVSELALKRERDSLAVKVEKKTKELRIQQAEKVAQLYRFAEFGKLTSGFLHDLSNSVNLVSANLKQIEKNGSEIEDMRETIVRARVGTKRLESFILATRKQINNQEVLENFSINQEIEQAIEILSYKAKKAHVFTNFMSLNEIRTYGNPIKFHQLVTNLLSNAIDAYEGSKKIKKEIEINLDKKRELIVLSIKDYGMGIPEKDLGNIFEPFFTTKGFKKGTGIGLSICHDIVAKNFNGKIEVESKVKEGTKITVKFPKRLSS